MLRSEAIRSWPKPRESTPGAPDGARWCPMVPDA